MAKVKIKMNWEGVQALKTLAAALPEHAKEISSATTALESAFDEHKNTLGPYSDDIEKIVETINQGQKKGHDSMVKVQKNLILAAAALSKLINSKVNVSNP